MFTARNIVMGLISAAAMMTCVSAQAGDRPFMPRGEGVGAPIGFSELCRRDIVTCGLPTAQLALLGVAAPSGTALTSSLGLGARNHPISPSVSDENADLMLLSLETVEAYTIGSIDDFIAAGQERPVTTPERQASDPTWFDRSERDQMKLLNRINQQINRDVRKADDRDVYGQEEYWALPKLVDGKLYGDCEDFALEKRRQLMAAGVPESALSLAVAITARGEGHAVLVVSLKSGDWVLDNLTPWATPWADLNYQWVERQVPGTALWTAVA